MVYQLRQNRLELQRQLTEMEDFEKALKEHIINTLPKSNQEGAQGKVARVTINRKAIPQVRDWDAFYAYVHRHKAYELLQRRPAEKAIEERLEAGKKVPGVEIFHAVSLSINKV